jgi:hypothetical protein
MNTVYQFSNENFDIFTEDFILWVDTDDSTAVHHQLEEYGQIADINI